MKGIDQRIAELSPDQLANLFERLGRARPAVSRARLSPPVARRQHSPGIRPLSFAQERLWFLDQLSPGSSDYNVAGALRIHGEVAVSAFEQALREIVRRHEVLRASFRAVYGKPVQVVTEDLCWSPAHVDLAGLLPAAGVGEAGHLARMVAREPFDLAIAPLLRVCWLHLGPGDHVLVFTFHHVVCDGWSIEIITRELVELYQGLAAGLPVRLPELPVQYADFAEWQREQLTGERLDQLLGYWRRQLLGARAELDLSRGAHPSSGSEGRAAERVFPLGAEVSARLGALGRVEQATPFMVLTALFSALLHVESGQQDLCLGANAAHRGVAGTEGLIGFFVNQVVLRLRPRASGSFRELLRQVCQVVQEAHAHQDLPFEKLVEALCPERSSSRSPLFQAKVDFQGDTAPLELPGLHLSSLELGGPPLRCDLLLTGWSSTAGIQCALAYDTGRFPDEAVRQMVVGFKAIAGIVAGEPDIPLLELAKRLSWKTERQRSAERERLDAMGAARLKSTRRKAVQVGPPTEDLDVNPG